MTTTITWKFPSVDVIKSVDGMSDVIETIHWCLSATDGTNVVETFGATSLSPPAQGSAFVPFSNLTEATIVEWLKALIPLQAYEDDLNERLASMQVPKVVKMVLPFVTESVVGAPVPQPEPEQEQEVVGDTPGVPAHTP